jgi:hypothetical protein
MTGDEAFADYYALSATGGLGKGESMAWGDVSIDPQKLHQFSAALGRLGRRQHLAPLNLTEALTARSRHCAAWHSRRRRNLIGAAACSASARRPRTARTT